MTGNMAPVFFYWRKRFLCACYPLRINVLGGMALMNDGEKMLLSDAIETAIRSEKKIIVQSRIIVALSFLCALLAVRQVLR